MKKSLFWVLIPVIIFIFGSSTIAHSDSISAQLAKLSNDEKIEVLLNLSKSNWSTNPHKSLSLSKDAYQIALHENNQVLQCDALNRIGTAYYFLETNDSALRYFKQSYAMSKQLGYLQGISNAANNLGLVYKIFGDYNKTINYYIQTLKIEKESNNKHGVASAYLNIGSVYFNLEEYDNALEYMTNALYLYKELNDSVGILKCKTNIGTTYSDLSLLSNAQDYISQAIRLSRLMNNIDIEASNLNNLGKVFFKKKDYKQALEYFNHALLLQKQQANVWSEANTLTNIAGVYIEKGEFSKALPYLKKGLDLAQKIKANQLLTEIYFDLYSVYNSQNNYPQAISFLRKHQQLSDSIYNLKSRREIANANIRYKLNLQESDMKTLQAENELKSLKIKNQQYLIYIFASLLVVILFMVFFLYYRSRVHLRAKNLEESKNTQISEKNMLLEKALSAIKESEEKYKALSESIQDGLVILQNKKLVFINEKLCSLLGYRSQEEMQNLQPQDVITREDVQKIISNYEKRVNGENAPNNYPVNLRNKEGQSIETNLCVTVTQLHGVPAIIGTFKIISDLKKYESQLLLEKEKAEQATLAKSLFLAGMSHEIRNHLNSIIGITEILAESNLKGELGEYVTIINKSGNKLMTIINDILDLSKIEAGQVSLDLDEFNLHTLVKDIEAQFELPARKQGLYIKTSMEPDIPEMLIGDMQRLSQVLINLTGNAIKFTDIGGIHIQIEIEERFKDYLILKFNVIDTGVGISADSQKKLFKAFSQTHSAIQRKQKGTGLGLVICKNIVQLMGGKIGVDSSLNKGSNFWFTAQFKYVNNLPNPSDSENNKFMDDKILLVEDNLLNQHLTTTILGKQGYKTDVADNGRIGVDMFRKKFYKIILMDIQMPEMDGIQATRLIREYESANYGSQSTIIAVTAHAKEGEKEKLFDAGMNHYISKPFKPDDLLTLLNYIKNS